MYPKSTFQYRTNFAKIVEVNFFHEFYTDKRLTGIDIAPDVETLRQLRNYSLLFKEQTNGFVILMDKSILLQSPTFAGPLELKFDFTVKDQYFLNITDIPFHYNHLFVFKNEFPDTNLLHKNFYVDEENIFESQKGGISGRIELKINDNNEFFGSEEDDKTKFTLLNYEVKFNSRKVKTRFNLYSNQADIDLKQYYIVDESDQKRLDDFQARTLENGLDVTSYVFEQSYSIKDRYDFKFSLKKDDPYEKTFSKTSPQPTIKSMSYDRIINQFINDIFILVD